MAVFAFLSYFKPWWKQTDTDYETVLSRLTSDITEVQTRLTQVKTRERRASVTLTFNAFFLYAAYVACCWYLRPLITSHPRGVVVAAYLPVVLIPFLIIYTRRIVRWWYNRISEGEEKHLRSLQRARRTKIDEIKRASRFDYMRMLLDKYDDIQPPSRARQAASSAKIGDSPAKGPGGGLAAPGSSPRSRPTTAPGNASRAPFSNASTPPVPAVPGNGSAHAPPHDQAGTAKTPAQGSAVPLAAQAVPPRTWLDRVADLILGSENGDGTLRDEQKYALICKECLNHNGLCLPSEIEEIQYICPKCGTFNSRRPSTAPISSPWGRARFDSTASIQSMSGASPSPNSRAQGERGHQRPHSVAGFSTDFLTPERALSDREGSGRPLSPLHQPVTGADHELDGDSEAEVEEEAWEELRDSEEDDTPPDEPLNSSDPAGTRSSRASGKGLAGSKGPKSRGSGPTRRSSTLRSRRSGKPDLMDVD
ncbi:hypothetical protein IE81DRAFT_322413 [Ceraceosorus guamensis]|uniref:Endoplasmic reticulum junction formation protein lunapark n=1 Tax=Ceraceosorus guamensis TaxID=1522189 RepID=A0A316W3I8_9BASI|nr:hypothetical protein IE81DRAFT_322413 [Ceraceosorus guamensis]PWN43343.1 hypothetical protein IE81DRAFT_322413 [Ceraceosorus guamensis]